MPIPSVEATTGTGYLTGAESLTALSPAAGPDATGVAGASAFAEVLGGAVDSTQQLQGTANELAIAAVTGDLENVHEATIASTRAQTTLELVAAVRNKAVDAFTEIMRMQA
jgi:flagellar hook-basal body complex protein FliE